MLQNLHEFLLHEFLSRYSEFGKLQRATAWLLRFKSYLKWKYLHHSDPPPNGFITVAELEVASLEIVKLTQRGSLATELEYFRDRTASGPPHPTSTSNRRLKSPFMKVLLACNPFILNGILRVGGRLEHSDLPIDQKHPMILPPHHHVTRLIVEMCHRDAGHSGTLHVLATVREKYWILRGQSAVGKILRECISCRQRSARVGEQWMADLPRSRVMAGHRPFHSTFVDYFGPIKVKLGRSEHKRYGCIFTCMATRAIHLEAVESLDTSAFLQAFFRFADRRGKPSHMFSDNGTNFIAGNKALSDGIRNWNQHQINKTLAQNQIQWHFSTPLASHTNGVVERMIREVKKTLHAVTDGRNLSDYSLWSFLTGIESILNDRPLTPLSDDPRDCNPLTPNTVLIGKLDPSLPPDRFLKTDEYRKGYRHTQRMLDLFWDRWQKEYLPLLQKRQKWLQPQRNLQVGDLVLLSEINAPRSAWPKGVVEETYPDRHGLVRKVKVRTGISSFLRDVRKVCLLEAA